jgi:thymidylate synthase (FAD)
VFEHCNLNFIVTNCSRVYTHEQVRQRAGWAYSQTSGRYCRLDSINLVWSELLNPVKDLWLKHLGATEDLVYLSECRLGLRKPPVGLENATPERSLYYREQGNDEAAGRYRWVPDDSFDFEKRKAITSAIRRIAPNGQANEIGMTCNIRALRHVVQLRTSKHAETEIRDIFYQVYNLISTEFPTIFYKSRRRMHNGIPEIFGMRMNPYEIEAGDPKALEFWTTESLQAELSSRAEIGASKT